MKGTEGIFADPDIRELVLHDMFKRKVKSTESAALGSNCAGCPMLSLLEAFQLMSTRMSLEMHVYISHLNQITEMSSMSMGKYVIKIQK